MASKNLASASAAALSKEAAEIVGNADVVDSVEPGTAASISDSASIQGVNERGGTSGLATAIREEFEMPVHDRDGNVKSTILIQRL